VLKNLQLTNFRGFEQLELKQLNRVNLIVGDNNTGKTSILEALYLLLGQTHKLGAFPSVFRAFEKRPLGGGVYRSPAGEAYASSQGDVYNRPADNESVPKPNRDAFERFWLWLFRDRQTTNSITVSAKDELNIMRQVEVRTHPPEPGVIARCFRVDPRSNGEVFRMNANGTTSFFAVNDPSIRVSRLSVQPSSPTEDAAKFNHAVNRPGGEESAEAFMRKMEPRLRKLRYRKLETESEPIVYAEIGALPEFIPSSQLGQAFTRMLHIYCELMIEKAGLLLADEIENGVYFANLQPFWSGIYNLVEEQNSQIVATTHSFECMKAAHLAACERADNGGTYDLNIIRLDRVDWGIKATEFGRKTMEVAIANGWEMR
jgi:hypothetical protein